MIINDGRIRTVKAFRSLLVTSMLIGYQYGMVVVCKFTQTGCPGTRRRGSDSYDGKGTRVMCLMHGRRCPWSYPVQYRRERAD